MRTIYRIASDDRMLHGHYWSRVTGGPKPDERGNIRIERALYMIDSQKDFRGTRRKIFPPWAHEDVVYRYFRKGNPVQIDLLDFTKSEIDPSTVDKIVDASFIGNLFPRGMDLKDLLLILAIVSNFILGFVLYTMVKK